MASDEKLQAAGVQKVKEELWAEELSECCQGLALARLIFNGNNREEDGLIADMLTEALKLRESLQDKAPHAVESGVDPPFQPAS